MKKASGQNRTKLLPNPKAKLFDQVREVMRFHHYSYRTEKTYRQWIRRFLAYYRKPDHSGYQSGWRHPRDLAAGDVAAFLTHLAVAGDVAASTQRQALNALVFLYRDVLGMELGAIGQIEKPQRQAKLPTVLTKEEVRRVLALVALEHRLPCQLLYGTGMRLLECLRLRFA